MNMLTLDWTIRSRDASRTRELRSEIDYYTELIRSTGKGYDIFTEKMLQNMLDIRFGGIAETIREGDQPKGRVLKVVYMDGATCYPTYNEDWPVVQQVYGNPLQSIPFPDHAVNRIYTTPRPEIDRQGWGMAPPEKIYLAMQLLVRGDRYYANLLLDTPEVGILDLGEADETSANQFLDSWKTLLAGTDPFKIPVLYEHEGDAKFISFTRPPTEMMFDKALARYSNICAAGYGLSPNDVGDLSIAASTLAAAIRQERRSRRTGIGMVMTKWKMFWDRVLPGTLEFTYVERDDETMLNRGRSRLASSLALGNAVTTGSITPATMTAQMMEDGLLTIPLDAEEEAAKAKQLMQEQQAQELASKKPDQTTRETLAHDKVPASQGGEGEQQTRRSLVLPASRARRYAKTAIRGVLTAFKDAEDHLFPDEKAVWRASFTDFVSSGVGDETFSAYVGDLQGAQTAISEAILKDNNPWMLSLLGEGTIEAELRTEYEAEKAFLVDQYEDEDEQVVTDPVPDEVFKEQAAQFTTEFRSMLGELVSTISSVSAVQLMGDSADGDNVDVISEYIQARIEKSLPDFRKITSSVERTWARSLAAQHVRSMKHDSPITSEE